MEVKEIISSGLLELYAAGIATEKEAADVERWIAQYPEVASELQQISAGVEAYAFDAPLTPSLTVKEKIFVQIGANAQAPIVPITPLPHTSEGPARIGFWKMVAAACALLLVASVIGNIITYNKFSQADKQLITARQTLENLKSENDEMAAGMDIVQSKYSVPVALKGLEAAPEAAAKIFWMKNTGEVFVDPSNLPVPPAGKRYQLWGIVDGKPVSGGMILSTGVGQRYKVQKMVSFGRVEAFAITLEAADDNLAPKGPMYVMGEIQ